MSIKLSELPFILSVQRAGSLTGAARSLGIDHSTAFRRLQNIERRIGEPLFERRPGGVYAATSIGRKFAHAAERLSEAVHQLNRDVLGADHRLTGLLRITTSESIAQTLLLPHLHAFQLQHPALDLALDVSNRQLDLARSEADIAVRTVRPVSGALWGRRVALIAWAVYKRRDGRSKAPEHSQGYIGWDAEASSMRVARWIEAEAYGTPIRFRTSSLLQQQRAAQAGFGLAVLPCYLGDTDQLLQRADAQPIPLLRDELWVVAHQQLRKAARIRAFLDFIVPALKINTGLIEGRQPLRVSGLRKRT